MPIIDLIISVVDMFEEYDHLPRLWQGNYLHTSIMARKMIYIPRLWQGYYLHTSIMAG